MVADQKGVRGSIADCRLDLTNGLAQFETITRFGWCRRVYRGHRRDPRPRQAEAGIIEEI